MRRALLECMGGIPFARWQDDAQLHLTLGFIGEVDRRRADEIATALQMIDGPCPTLAIDGVGAFDRRGTVHTLYARVAPDEALFRLRQRVDRAIASVGLPPEHRAFVPHVTLARLSQSAPAIVGFVQRNAGLTAPAATLDDFLLYESMLGSGGAVYHVAARYGLTRSR